MENKFGAPCLDLTKSPKKMVHMAIFGFTGRVRYGFGCFTNFFKDQDVLSKRFNLSTVLITQNVFYIYRKAAKSLKVWEFLYNLNKSILVSPFFGIRWFKTLSTPTFH